VGGDHHHRHGAGDEGANIRIRKSEVKSQKAGMVRRLMVGSFGPTSTWCSGRGPAASLETAQKKPIGRSETFRTSGGKAAKSAHRAAEHIKSSVVSVSTSLAIPLGHLSPNRSLANLAALYPLNGLPDLHRHFKLAIILGLSEGGQSAFVP